MVTALAGDDANIIFGAVIDDQYEGEVHVTIVATGFEPAFEDQIIAGKVKSPAYLSEVLLAPRPPPLPSHTAPKGTAHILRPMHPRFFEGPAEQTVVSQPRYCGSCSRTQRHRRRGVAGCTDSRADATPGRPPSRGTPAMAHHTIIPSVTAPKATVSTATDSTASGSPARPR